MSPARAALVALVALSSGTGLLACGPASPPTGVAPGEAPPVELRVALEGAPKAGGGKVVVQATFDPAGRVEVPDLGTVGIERLTFTPDGPPIQEQVGDHAVVTQRYVFRGPRGNYEIPPLTARWEGGDRQVEAQSGSVFLDLDAPPPREGELADIVGPEPVIRWPWVAVVSVAALFVGGLLLAFRPRRAPAAAAQRQVPPDQVALEAWDRVRRDPDLTIDDKAREVARIFREYTEAVLGFEATSRTTHELLERLESLVHLPEGNVVRARRVLRAADRIKFAEQRPAGDWLEELDADLRGFVRDTRPASWQAGERGQAR